jgi:cytochrome c-type biogenesis protein
VGTVDALSLSALGLAFLAGAASFLSPCVLPLLPGYLSFISGASLDELTQGDRRVVLRTLAFVVGFALVFTAMGAGAGFVGGALLRNRRTLQIVGGVMLVVMGAATSGLLPLGRLERERRLLPFRAPQGMLGAGLTGVAFSIGWTPCVGPILASILTLAASRRDPLAGAVLLFAYSLGLGVPFLLSGLFFTRAMRAFAVVKRHMGAVRAVSGLILVAYGLLMIGGQMTWLTARLSRYRFFEL